MAVRCPGAHCPPEVMRMGVGWYGAYPLRTRHVAALMEERGVEVAPSTVHRGVLQDSPQLEEAWPRRKRPVWVRWRMDEPYSTVTGEWRALSRAVDQQGQTMAFLLTAHRAQEA